MDEAQAKFSHSAALIIHMWSALDIAVQNEWAGPDSADIRDWLGGVIVDMFTFPQTKKVEVEDVEEVLTQVVEDEFELRLEDDSAYQVAKDIVQSYERCLVGDFAHVDVLDELFQKLRRRPRNDQSVEAPSQEVDDDEGEGEGEDDDSSRMDVEEIDVEPTSRQGPIIDDEGFELVQKGRRKGR